MKKIYLYGNWKMNMNRTETLHFLNEYKNAIPSLKAALDNELEVAIFPPFTSLWSFSEAVAGYTQEGERQLFPYLGAQNVYYESEGAYTGEVSISMLQECGCTHVLVGHSERRSIMKEDDKLISLKIRACLKKGVTPVLCYGETLDERESGSTFSVVKSQLERGLHGLSPSDLQNIIYAYEPVWAIGTGKSANAKEAEEVCSFSKKCLAEMSLDASSAVVLYGGSVKESNAKELLSAPSIDGALVGGASLQVKSFLNIYRAYKA